MRDDWAKKMLNKVQNEKKQKAQFFQVVVRQLKDEIQTIDNKINNLLDLHLDGSISRKLFLRKKADLLLTRKTLEERVVNFNGEQAINEESEQIETFISISQQAKYISDNGDLHKMATWLEESNSNIEIFNKKNSHEKIWKKI